MGAAAARAKARLDAIVGAMPSRPTDGETVESMRYGDEMVRQLAAFVALEGSPAPDAQERRLLLSYRIGALMGEAAPRVGQLEWIAQREDRTGRHDPQFWAVVGGRPEHYSPSDPVYWQQQRSRDAAERREREKGIQMPAAWLAAMDELSARFGLPPTHRNPDGTAMGALSALTPTESGGPWSAAY